MCVAVYLYLIYINGVFSCSPWKQSLRQEFCSSDLLGENTQKKGSGASGMGQRKELSKDGASETSFSLIPQEAWVAQVVVHLIQLEGRGWTFVCPASLSLAEVLPFLGMLGNTSRTRRFL